MEYEIEIKIKVDKNANFLEVDIKNNVEVIKQLTLNSMYDIDDITILRCEVNTYD